MEINSRTWQAPCEHIHPGFSKKSGSMSILEHYKTRRVSCSQNIKVDAFVCLEIEKMKRGQMSIALWSHFPLRQRHRIIVSCNKIEHSWGFLSNKKKLHFSTTNTHEQLKEASRFNTFRACVTRGMNTGTGRTRTESPALNEQQENYKLSQ